MASIKKTNVRCKQMQAKMQRKKESLYTSWRNPLGSKYSFFQRYCLNCCIIQMYCLWVLCPKEASRQTKKAADQMLSIRRYVDKEEAVFTHRGASSSYKEGKYTICRKMGESEPAPENIFHIFFANEDSRFMYKFTHIWGMKLEGENDSR